MKLFVVTTHDTSRDRLYYTLFESIDLVKEYAKKCPLKNKKVIHVYVTENDIVDELVGGNENE